jgi:alkanesulfonate monooxygenase SsuD/methylene tetrahydromethanopterin reductase-like flavin-dependent oxidoreductase (luciferase family)
MELGLYSFGEMTPDGPTPRERLEQTLEEIALADRLGLDVFAIGEQYDQPPFAVCAPIVVLSMAAARTERIRLTSGVTVLGAADPVRVFQEYATLDLLSGGRAEIVAGRGSSAQAHELYGNDLQHYDEAFAEKLELLLRLRADERVTWSGRFRSALHDQAIYPRPLQDPLPVWVGVGGDPGSAARAGALGLPMGLAIIGGNPEGFVPFAELHRRSAAQAGHARPALSINSHGLIAETAREARDEARPGFLRLANWFRRHRGAPEATERDFERAVSLHGADFIGAPQDIVDKIVFQHEHFGHDRFLMKMNVGGVSHAAIMRSIELYANVVAPAVRERVGGLAVARTPPATS